MLVVALACLAVAVGLGAALIWARRRASDLQIRLDAVTGQRDAARAEANAADDRASAALRERDDAFERVQRARRDAAEVAGRLRDESAARAQADASAAVATSRADGLERELAETIEALEALEARTAELDQMARQPVASDAAPGGAGDLELLWELALARAEATWRTSISLSLDEESPLASSQQPLRAAIEILIEAAREEAGADMELEWSGAVPVPPASAVVVFSLVESVIASVAKSAGSTTVRVTVSEDGIELGFDAVDDTGRPLAITLPATVSEAPGEARIPLTVRT